MEYNEKKSHVSSGQKSNNGINDRKHGLGYIIKKAFDSQIFYNSRLKALEYIEKQSKISTAMLSMTISRVKSFLGANFEVKFSLLYSTDGGKILQVNDFYTVELPGKEGRIPNYILKSLDEEDSVNIKFNSKDLSVLYDERSVKIDEESTFDELIGVCKKENVATIQMIDRVFYTRIECLDAANQQVGTIHVGALYGLPKELANVLYPCGQATFDV